MGKFYFVKMENERKIKTSETFRSLMNNTWSYAERMLGKYTLGEGGLDAIMDMDPDTYKDLREGYKLSKDLLTCANQMADQMDQMTDLLFLITKQNETLNRQIESLQSDIDSLKSSKAKKTLDDFKKGIDLFKVEEE